MANIMVSCEKCKEKFPMLANFENRSVEINGSKLELTVLICPFCGSEMTVQIDNSKTTRLFKKQLELSRKEGISNFYRKKPKHNPKIDIISSEIRRLRADLNAKYNGSVYLFEGKEKKLEFSAPTTKIVG